MSTNEITRQLIEVVGAQHILTGDDLNNRYAHIWRMDHPLHVKALLLPKSAQEVSQILSLCHLHKQSVVVHGGLTNLVGSTEAEPQDVVISLERMNKIEEVDTSSRSVTVQAGVRLEEVHMAVEDQDLFFPLNFGARGSAQIGGIVSSNAGGLRVLRYGMTRQLVLGLEAVMADGTIISNLKKIIKDNSGYDLKQLFIGAEGTLGIITKVVLKLTEKPTSRNSGLAALQDYESVVSFLKYMDKGLKGMMSGYELMWQNYYEAATSSPSEVRPPLPHGSKYYVLVECLGNNHQQEAVQLENLFEDALTDNIILDAVFAQNTTDLEWFWRIREDVHAVTSRHQYDQHFDISLPVGQIGAAVDQILDDLTTINRIENIYTFGHVADGNIHFIIGKDTNDDLLRLKINDIIYKPIHRLNGSVSAEHGIGIDKKAYLQHCRSEEEIKLMKLIKKTLDPHNILNPGRILDIHS